MVNVEGLAKQKHAGARLGVYWGGNRNETYLGKVLIKWEGLSWAVPSTCRSTMILTEGSPAM